MKVFSEEQQGDTSESRLNNAKSVNDKKRQPVTDVLQRKAHIDVIIPKLMNACMYSSMVQPIAVTHFSSLIERM